MLRLFNYNGGTNGVATVINRRSRGVNNQRRERYDRQEIFSTTQERNRHLAIQPNPMVPYGYGFRGNRYSDDD